MCSQALIFFIWSWVSTLANLSMESRYGYFSLISKVSLTSSVFKALYSNSFDLPIFFPTVLSIPKLPFVFHGFYISFYTSILVYLYTYLMGIEPLSLPRKHPAQAQVCYLEMTLFADQQICGLQVLSELKRRWRTAGNVIVMVSRLKVDKFSLKTIDEFNKRKYSVNGLLLSYKNLRIIIV